MAKIPPFNRFASLSKSGDSQLEKFMDRVIITIVVIIMVGTLLLGLVLYLPLTKALEKSKIENFAATSRIHHEIVSGEIERSWEGAKGVSSRTMIREAASDYLDGKMTLEALRQFTTPKYMDGVSTLQNIKKAERIVDGELVAYYIRDYANEYLKDVSFGLCEQHRHGVKIIKQHEKLYLMVSSPVIHNGRRVACDNMVFDISDVVGFTDDKNIKADVFVGDEYKDFLNKTQIKINVDSVSIFEDSKDYYCVNEIDQGVFLIMKQDKKTMMASATAISRRVFVAGVFMLALLIFVIYFFIIRHARMEMKDMVICRVALGKATSEANTDSLTGVGNRRSADEYLEEAHQAFLLENRPCLITMFDIDDFKEINDTHGHNVGDLVLVKVAESAKSVIRETDGIFRWGGDEFVVALKEAGEKELVHIYRRIKEVVNRLKLESERGGIKIGLSFGVSAFKKEDKSFKDAVERADKAMYISKSERERKINFLY